LFKAKQEEEMNRLLPMIETNDYRCPQSKYNKSIYTEADYVITFNKTRWIYIIGKANNLMKY